MAEPYPYPLREAVPGVWSLRLAWTRAHVLSNGGEFMLLDSGTCHDRELLLAGLAALGLEPRRCRAVLLTHGHCDHAGNAAYFAEQFGASLQAHTDERTYLETPRSYVPEGYRRWTIFGLKAAMFAGAEVLYPVRRRHLDRLLDEGDTVETPAGAWRVVHTPGHTPGHISFFRETDGALLSGDALLNVVPFANRSGLAVSPPLFSSDYALARRSARRLAELAPRTLLPGHGPTLPNATEPIRRFAARLRD